MSVAFFPLKLRRRAVVRVRHAGDVCWVYCAGCGCTGDVAREVEELSAAGVDHGTGCPVKYALWRELVDRRLGENGRRPGRGRRRRAA